MIKRSAFLPLSLALFACTPRAEDVPPNDSQTGGAVPSDSVQAVAGDTAVAPAPGAALDTAAPTPGTGPTSGTAQTPAAVQGADSARGTIVVTGVGPSPYATLSSGQGPPIVLTGALEPELRQLGGAQVAVFGERTGSQRVSMRVQRYDILAIDGERPVVGTVLADGQRVVAGRDTIDVLGHPGPLPAGAKIWITGHRQGAEIHLLSWGVIRS